MADWVVPLSDEHLLRRISVDLHGRLPSAETMQALRDQDKTVDELRDEMLAAPELEEGIIHLLTEPWNTQSEHFHLNPERLDIPSDEHQEYYRSIGEEPLRLAAHVVTTQRPWSDIATIEYTMTTEMLLDIWPLERAQDIAHLGDENWFPARYTDGRPDLGVVGTNGFGWRFDQALWGRSRAAAISSVLLCHEYLDRPVSFSGESLIEFDTLEEATQTVPSCQNCHSNLDPVASALFGFMGQEGYSITDSAWYHAEFERLGIHYLGAEPGWYGTPIYQVDDLGTYLAADGRLPVCAVEQFTGAMLHRETDLLDFAQLEARTTDFLENGQLVHLMLSEITDSPEYRAGALTDEAPDWLDDRVATRRIMSPAQLADSIEHLTGFRWMEAGWDQMENDHLGFRVMSGGIQPPGILTLGKNPTAVRSLVIKQLAQLAADHVVATDLDRSDAQLLTIATSDTTPDSAEFDEQLTDLYWRLYAQEPTTAELTELADLWFELESMVATEEQWSVLLSVMLRDPRFWTY